MLFGLRKLKGMNVIDIRHNSGINVKGEYYMDLHYIQGEPLFARTNKVPKQYPYLTEDIETEVAVIGGGITGAIVSYYLTKNNIPCVVIEQSRAGLGSTCASTALLQYELDSLARDVEAYIPMEDILTTYRLGEEALQEIKEIIETYGNKCGYEEKDTLIYTAKGTEIGCIEEEYRIRKEAGFNVDLITEEKNPFAFELKAGVYAHKGGAQIDPYRFTHQLLEIGEAKGLRVYENTAVNKVDYGMEDVVLQVSYGYKVKAKKIILATGYDTGAFSTRSYGIKTVSYNIASKPVESFEGWPQTPLIRDNNDPYFYYRTTSDNRIIVGGQDIPFENNIFNEKVAQEKYEILESRMKAMFPKIPNLEIEYRYCGCFTSTSDNVGFVGSDLEHKQLWYCLGYGANGILYDVIGAKMLTGLYKGEVDPRLRLFEISRFDN